MATYTDIRNLFSDSDVKNKVEVACVVKAYALINKTTPTADEITMAVSILESPTKTGAKIFLAVLAASKASNVSAIQSASDAQIQTTVDGVIDKLVGVLV